MRNLHENYDFTIKKSKNNHESTLKIHMKNRLFVPKTKLQFSVRAPPMKILDPLPNKGLNLPFIEILV